MEVWTIARRITALIALGLTASLLIAAVSLGGQWMLSTTFADFGKSNQQTQNAYKVREDILIAEALARDFNSRGNPELLPRMARILDDIDQRTGADALNITHRESRETYERVNALVVDYSLGFEQVVTSQDQLGHQVENMLDAGNAAIESVEELTSLAYIDGKFSGARMTSRAIQDFVLARLHMERFLLNNDPNDYEVAQEWLLKAAKSLDRSVSLLPGDRFNAHHDAAGDALEAFTVSGQAVFSGINARNRYREKVRMIGQEIVQLTDQALSSTTSQQQFLVKNNERTQLIVVSVLAAIILFALGAMLWFGRQFSRAIDHEIETIVADMSGIADGRLDTEIKGLDRLTEVGDMARALEVFRQNAISARDLTEDMRRKDEAEKRRKEEEAALARKVEAERQAALDIERKAIITDLSDALGSVVRAASRGDFSRRIDRSFEDEELAAIADAINDLVERVERSLGETARVLGEIASGDLTERMQGDFQGLFADLRDALGTTTDTLSSLVLQIRQQSEDIGENAELMSERADDLATRAEHQAATLEQTSQAMKELSGTVKDSAEAARHSVGIASQASGKADAAGEVVNSAISAMTDIREASTKITEIVSVMESIAFQTNLLALNASVEAARAGSAGKGFAVVATEVRALAQRSGNASKDIKELIEATSTQVDRGVSLVARTGETLGEVVEGVREMAKTLEGLTDTAQEQATGIGEVATAVSELDAITQKNAAVADDSRVAANTLGQQMDVLNGLVNRFRIDKSTVAHIPIAAE